MNSADGHLQCITWFFGRHHVNFHEMCGKTSRSAADRKVRQSPNETQTLDLPAKAPGT